MAEAVGLALTVAAYKTSKSLHEAVSIFKSQRKPIKDIQADLKFLITVLENPRNLLKVHPTSRNCLRSCDWVLYLAELPILLFTKTNPAR